MASAEKTREYLLHIPRSYEKSKKDVPLVLMLHGRTSNGKAAASDYYGWTKLAEKEGFVVAFPTALGTPTSWEGAWLGKPTHDSIFLAELIDSLLKELRIDEARIFMTGHSSGGFMSYSFATTHSDKIAAIGPVAGLRLGLGEPSAPVSVISFHGMADRVVAYDDERGKNAAFKGMPSAVDSAAFFAKHNGCGKKKREDAAKGKVHVDRWPQGKADSEVVLYSIEDGDHGWPKKSSHGVEATELIWKFFKAHPRATDRKR
ncbi:MAG: PHB depolymerase family esterase [Planctomycetota bacterium]